MKVEERRESHLREVVQSRSLRLLLDVVRGSGSGFWLAVSLFKGVAMLTSCTWETMRNFIVDAQLNSNDTRCIVYDVMFNTPFARESSAETASPLICKLQGGRLNSTGKIKS